MRVTIDLDTKNKKKLEYSYEMLKYLTNKEPELYISSSGRGYHLIVRGCDITFKKSLLFRKICGDDPIRIKLDKERAWKAKQVLFTRKNGKKVKKTTIQKETKRRITDWRW